MQLWLDLGGHHLLDRVKGLLGHQLRLDVLYCLEKLLAVNLFFFNQDLGNCIQHVSVFRQQVHATLVLLCQDAIDLGVGLVLHIGSFVGTAHHHLLHR